MRNTLHMESKFFDTF